MKKDLISWLDYSKQEIEELLSYAIKLKKLQKEGNPEKPLLNKSLAMIFEKPSNRTRVSFDVGMFQLGGYSLNLEPSSIQVNGRESLYDVSKTLSRFVDGIMLRTFSHKTVTDFAKYADVPVINGLTDYNHPCQALADVMTIQEHKGNLDDITLAYVGDGNNVLTSLMFIAGKLGFKVKAACPEGYFPTESVMQNVYKYASKDQIVILTDPVEAVENSDAVYTDVWASMGQEEEVAERKRIFADFQVNSNLMSYAKEDAVFMHCLPAHRGDEVTDEVVDAPFSVVFDEAENRLHAQKAILATLIK